MGITRIEAPRRALILGVAGTVLATPALAQSGYPAKPIRQSLREAVWLAKQVSSRKGNRES